MRKALTFDEKMIRPALIHFKSVIVILGYPPKQGENKLIIIRVTFDS